MKLSLLIAASLLASAPVFADSRPVPHCPPPETMDILPVLNLVSTIKLLDFPSPCPPEDQMYLDQSRKEYESLKDPKERQILGDVRGVSLQATREELEWIEKILGDEPPVDWKDRVQGATDTVTFLKGLFKSEESAYRVLSIARKFGHTMSVHQMSKEPKAERIWTASELRSAQKAMEALPPSFRNLPYLTGIRRGDPKAMKQEKNAGLHWCSQKGYIVILDGAFLTATEGSKTIAHELTHAFDCVAYIKDGTGSYRENSGFIDLSWDEITTEQFASDGTKTKKTEWRRQPGAQFPSEYASTAPAEDLAEAVSLYAFDPESAKATAPKKYDWVKKQIFAGREFLDPPIAPDVLAAIEELGGMDSLASRCLTRVNYLTYSREQKDLLAYLPSETKPGMLDGIWSDSFLANPSCLKAEMKQVLGAIASDAKNCRPAMDREVVAAFHHGLQARLGAPLQNAEKYLEKASNAGFPKCWAKRDFTFACQAAEIGMKPSDLPKAVAFKVREPDPGAEALRKLVEPNDMLLSCLGQFNRWFLGKDGIPFYMQNVSDKSGTAGLGDHPNCGVGATQYMNALGIRAEAGTEQKLRSHESFKGLASRFETEIVRKLVQAKSGCLTDDCIRDRVAALVDPWFAQEKITLDETKRSKWLDTLVKMAKDGISN